MLKREDIRIRDPFIVTDEENGCYYMFGTTALKPSTLAANNSFSVYKTKDLENFEEEKTVFNGADYPEFWADRDFWAPEIHKWQGKYYLFGSCKAEGKCRGTQIFVSDTVDGSYVPLTEEPITPRDWECLDGTLVVEDGIPYIVFCHEWLQVKNGEICAMPLTPDLKNAAGEPFLLFRATDNPAVTPIAWGEGNYVTDGPFFYREKGKLCMIWSSFYQGRYLVLTAKSDNLHGCWEHEGSKYPFDGGHAMIFTALDGKKMISLHSPNTAGAERAVFYEF